MKRALQTRFPSVFHFRVGPDMSRILRRWFLEDPFYEIAQDLSIQSLLLFSNCHSTEGIAMSYMGMGCDEHPGIESGICVSTALRLKFP
jgi:hypothetical protein